MAQLEAIRYEIRSVSLINPGPLTRRLMDNSADPAPETNSGTLTLQTFNMLYLFLFIIVFVIRQ